MRKEEDKNDIENLNKYKEEILKSFPYAISRRLQRLNSSESNRASIDEKESLFFDKADKYRLGELKRTSQTITDILLAVAQAELYKIILSDSFRFNPEDIKNLYDLYDESNFSTIISLKKWLSVLAKYDNKLYVPELIGLNAAEEFMDCGTFFENSLVDKLNSEEAANLVELAEIRLSNMFKHVAFLCQYNITSIEMILVKRRHLATPKYAHLHFYQKWNSAGIDKDSTTLTEKYFDHGSIILHKSDIANTEDFLNLSPFLIDSMLFTEKAIVSDLMAFHKLKTDKEEFFYRYLVYEATNKYPIFELYLKDNVESKEDIKYYNKAFREIKDTWHQYLKLLENHTK